MYEELFDDFIERTISRIDREICQPKFFCYGAFVSPVDIDIRVTADGYVRSSSKYGKNMELILGFVQVCEVIEEEIRRERGKRP